MKLKTHERSAKPTRQELRTLPMVIWLDRRHELVIEKGDRLLDVANVVSAHWALNDADAHQLAAFWFAIGERLHTKKLGKKWSVAELSMRVNRRYLMK